MVLILVLTAVSFMTLSPTDGKSELAKASSASSDVGRCLPQDTALTDVVSAPPGGLTPSKIRPVTVAAKLKEVGARCRKGKLVDLKGKEIRFYRLQGCWGNPPENYQEVLAEQAKELEALRKRYRVIEMTCNPTGELISKKVGQAFLPVLV
jgi:hypothetical protein